MYIKNIRIDGYGPWSELSLEGLAPGLNVFFGPPGSGKSSLRRCIAAIFNGFGSLPADDCDARRHAVVGGTLTVIHESGRHEISRYHDGTRQGRLILRAGDSTSHDPADLASVRQLPMPTFAALLEVDFHSRPSLRRLTQVITGSGLLAPHPATLEPFEPRTEAARRQAGQALEDARRELLDHQAKYPAADRRRERLQAEINRLADQIQARRAGVDDDRRERLAVVRRLEDEVRRLEDAIRAWEQSRDEEQQNPDGQRHREPAPRPAAPKREPQGETAPLLRRLEAVDQQVRRWRRVEQDVRQRREALRDELAQWDLNHARGSSAAPSPRRRLGLLEQHLAQLQQQLDQLAVESERSCVCRSALDQAGPLANQLREQLYLLCQELTHQQRRLRREAIVNELKQLRRCRVELADHLTRLTERRQELLAEYGRVDAAGLELYRLEEARACECSGHEEHLRRGRHASGCEALTDAAADQLWDAAARDAELAAVEVRHARWLQRHRELSEQLDVARRRLAEARRREGMPAADGSLDELTAALAERRAELDAWVVEQDRLREERSQLEERVRHWERKLEEEPPRAVVDADLLEVASDYLRRISGGKYIQVSGARQVGGGGQESLLWITSRDGQVYPHDVLGPRTYDQVYLSVRMAVSAVHARHGIRVPLLLDDPFLHLDVRQHPEVLDVITHFAEQHAQVLLLTGDPLAARLFSERDQWVRDLVMRPPSEAGGNGQASKHEDRAATAAVGSRTIVPRADWDPEEFPGELADRVVVAEREARQADEDRRRRAAGRAEIVERPWGHSRRYVSELLSGQAAPPETPRRAASGNGEATAQWKFYLETSSPIEDAPSIGRRMAEQLRGIGVTQVSDLLALSPKGAAAQLAHLTVPSETIRAWQAQAWLVCCVPHLRPYDARILVACGITDPDQLEEMEPRELLLRVERFLGTREGRQMVESGNDYELSRISTWIRLAREARRRWQRTRHRDRPRRSATDPASRPFAARREAGYQHAAGPYSTRPSGNGESPHSGVTDAAEAGDRNSGTENTHRGGYLSVGPHATARPRLWNEPAGSREERRAEERSDSAERSAESRFAAPRDASRNGHLDDDVAAEADEPWKFYLHRSSPVVDAPAIGPRTAERLEAIGIRTVADLLDADPLHVAQQLDYHRIKAETVRQWQAQARLVCRIPHLRGHDAQILVACGYTEPEQLIPLSVDDLYRVIRPFVATREGERIIRSGRRPDREEVADWLRWARHTRPLRAA